MPWPSLAALGRSFDGPYFALFPAPFTEHFQRTLAHGHCVAVRLPDFRQVSHLSLDCVPEDEQRLASTFGLRRQITFVGGRLALREGLRHYQVSPTGILATDRGAPLLPFGLRGSISHKDSLAVALVQPDQGWHVGIDIEFLKMPKTEIASDILTPRELDEYTREEDSHKTFALMARFSLKEALYKALDPFVRRYVGFEEVDVTLNDDGRASAALSLVQGEGPFESELHWFTFDDMILSTARVRKASNSG